MQESGQGHLGGSGSGPCGHVSTFPALTHCRRTRIIRLSGPDLGLAQLIGGAWPQWIMAEPPDSPILGNIPKKEKGERMSGGRIELFQGMLTADPSNTTVRYGLANELFKLARYEEAIEEYTRYLREADDQGAGYGKLAQALEHCQRIDEAREAYHRGIEAATRHGHPGMAQDFHQSLTDLA